MSEIELQTQIHRVEAEPSFERQQELESAYEINLVKGYPPYNDVDINSYGELIWVLRQRKWSGDFELPEGWERVNLKGANMPGVNLSGVKLCFAHLEGIDLTNANLERAELRFARLNALKTGSNEYSLSDFTGASLKRANLAGADFRGVYLRNANMQSANIADANLRSAHLEGADLRVAKMNDNTILDAVSFDSETKLGDVKWSGVSLTQVDWSKVLTLGDERLIHPNDYIIRGAINATQIEEYRNVARAYRNLALVLRNQGLLIPASRFRLREQQLECKALRAERKTFSWAGYQVLDIVSGYGEKTERVFISYLIVVITFALSYFVIIHGVKPLHFNLHPNHLLDAFVFSLTSFHGRGFFPGENASPHSLIVVLAAVEAVVGLFIELILIATFSRRFLGS